MSKLGKKHIAIPKETNVKVEGSKLILTGPKGSKELSVNDKIHIDLYKGSLFSIVKEKKRFKWILKKH